MTERNPLLGEIVDAKGVVRAYVEYAPGGAIAGFYVIRRVSTGGRLVNTGYTYTGNGIKAARAYYASGGDPRWAAVKGRTGAWAVTP
jgi:hypothetical protein